MSGPGRVMVLRMRNLLVNMKEGKHHQIDDNTKKDVNWWLWYLPQYNRVSIMWMKQCQENGDMLQTDSCLSGMGAFSLGHYTHYQYPGWLCNDDQFKIVHLEFLAIIVALKLWWRQLRACRFVIRCDNQAVVDIINSGYSKDQLLQDILREFVFVIATGECEVIARHIIGTQNENTRSFESLSCS